MYLTAHHLNLVKLRDYHFNEDYHYLVMEYCDLGNLQDFIDNQKDQLSVREVSHLAL
jgi:serine/threonine protein kinase